MAYHLEGQLLEVCNCKVLCPCWIGEDPDPGTCDAINAYHIERGTIAGLVALNAAGDIGGNTFYILSGQAGRLDVAAVLGSLYPGMTVLLAGLILHERLNRSQWAGIAAAMAAIVLMTIKTKMGG